jgi:preprotein translocase subunit SecD
MSRLGLRAGTIAAFILLIGYFALANFIPEATRLSSGLLPDQGLRLGLDLQGGIHWVLGVKLDVAEEHELDFLRGALETQLEEDGVIVDRLDVENRRLTVEASSEPARKAVQAWAADNDVLSEVSAGPDRLEYALSDAWKQEVRDRGMRQVLEVLRRRIDDPIQGIPESVVTRQGDDRVLVQIPGGQIARSSARELLRTTGVLEFKLVLDVAPSEELLVARYPEGLPDDTKLVFEKDSETDRVLNVFLVSESAQVTGDYLTDARMNFDNRQRPIVSFTFNAEGGKIFSEITSENIGTQLAIVLDDRVYSAPNIRSRIGSRGQIEGRFTNQEAADLAVVLRAGSLAVPVEIEEERTVGPALGADSIRRGVQASILGLILIVGFASGYYRLSGIYASGALLVNLLLLIGIMSLFESTLTLPGLAGVVLTVGMAVDANVIIFERIREELRTEKTPRAAVATGFNKATWTILDANITTLITAIVLFEYGTGPIQGFAVTLSIGILTSVFSALVFTRLLFALYPGTRHVESLSI